MERGEPDGRMPKGGGARESWRAASDGERRRSTTADRSRPHAPADAGGNGAPRRQAATRYGLRPQRGGVVADE